MTGKLPRAVFTVLVYIFGFLVFGIMANAKPCFAAISQVERPEEELLILELHIKDKIRSRAFLGYLPQGAALEDALFPLGALSRMLSFKIDVDPARGYAQGWFIEDGNAFRLDLEQNKAFTRGQEFPLDQGDVEAHYEDIYVQASVLEQWFDLQIEIDLGALRGYIKTDQLFPYEKEAQRKKRAEQYANMPDAQSYDYSSAELMPYKWFTLPSVVMQQSALYRHSLGDNHVQGTTSIQTSGDFLKFGTRMTLAGVTDSQNQSELQTATLTFQRRDPGNNLLGPLNAGRVAFGDVDFPDVPLIVSRKRGRGFSVSSESQLGTTRSFGPETTIIDGDAPIGWDVELYRNNHFVGFQEVDETGRYSFEDVTLIKGFNLFKVVLYGPEGQTRTETQRIVRGARMLRQGEKSYDFSVGQPEADFIPIAEDSRTDSTFGASGRFFYGVRENFTLGGSVFRGSDARSVSTEEQSAATVTAITGFKGIRTQAQLMRANEGRSAYDFEASTRILETNISAGHTIYEGFHEDDQRVKDVTSVNVGRKIGRFSANIEAEKRSFVEDTYKDEDSVKATISTRVSRVNLTNRLEKTWSENRAQENFDGEFVAAMDLWNWRLRSNLTYDLGDQVQDHLRNVRLTVDRRIGRDGRIRLNGTYDFSANRSTFDARYTKEFEDFSIDVNMGGSNDNEYFGGVAMRTALQADQDGKYHMVSARDGGLGSVGLRAYLDTNHNGQYDEGEKLLKNISFRSNRGIIDGTTDENGVIFINGLSESATRFSLQESSLPSIYLKPAFDYVDIIPRSGTTAKVDIAFTQLGEIDGFILASEKTEQGEPKAAPGIEVMLINADTGAEVDVIYSEYDGYYVFPALELGNYTVKVGATWEEDESSLPVQNVSLSDDEPIVMDVNITLPPRNSETMELSQNKQEIAEIEPAAGMALADRNTYIHISSMSAAQSAEYERSRLEEKFSSVLSGVSLDVRQVEVKGKTFYRIIGAVADKQQGQSLCDLLIARNIEGGCRVMRNRKQFAAKMVEKKQGHLFIHISSLSSESSAKHDLKALQEVHGEVLNGVELLIREAVVQGKTYYRIIGAVSDKQKGQDLCRKLKDRNIEGGCRLISL